MDKQPRHVASLTAALILVALAVAVACAVVLVRQPWAQHPHRAPATTTTVVRKSGHPHPAVRRPVIRTSTTTVAPRATPVVPAAPRPVPRPAPAPPTTAPHRATPSTAPKVCILLICVR